ncbi:MAG: sterol carrier protein domain-containing protein [Pirellulaceae bacterium]
MRRADSSHSQPTRAVRPVVDDHRSDLPAASAAIPIRSTAQAASPNPSTTVTHAEEGDQFAILRLMRHGRFPGSENDLHSQQERPGYHPRQRLVCRRGKELVGHIHCIPRDGWIGGESTRLIQASQLVLAPEHPADTIAGPLLSGIDRVLQASQCPLVVYRANPGTAQLLSNYGWTPLSPASISVAPTERILATLQHPVEDPHPFGSQTKTNAPLSIRLMRQVEVEALISIYNQFQQRHQLGTRRDQALWRWLLRRKAFECLYVAMTGGNKPALEDATRRIVGYAVVKDRRILELVTNPEADHARAPLFARICGDLYEADRREVEFNNPASDPLHPLIRAAQTESPPRPFEQVLVRMHDPLKWLAEMGPRLHARAKAAGLSLPLDLGLLIGDEKYALHFNNRRAILTDGKLGRSYLGLDLGQLVRLMLGDLCLKTALAREQITASTQLAQTLAETLFPYQPPWFPPLEDLPVA